MENNKTTSNAGRKRAISKEIVPIVRDLLAQGFGYRKIAGLLKEDYGVRLHWTRIRDFKKKRGVYSLPEYEDPRCQR